MTIVRKRVSAYCPLFNRSRRARTIVVQTVYLVTQSPSGTVLGAVKVSYSLAQVDAEIASSITKAGILQLIITVLGFGLLSLVFNHMVLRPSEALARYD